MLIQQQIDDGLAGVARGASDEGVFLVGHDGVLRLTPLIVQHACIFSEHHSYD